MNGISQLADINLQRRELALSQRQVEAEAFDVLCTRPVYFGFKLILGMRHKAPETEQPEETDQQPILV